MERHGTWRSSHEQRGLWARRRWSVILVLTTYVMCTVVDKHVFLVLRDPHYDRGDWHEMLRAVGFLPTWVLIGLCFVLHDWAPAGASRRSGPRVSRGVGIIACAALAGLAAEVLKVLIGRERPIHTDGEYVFRPFLRWIGEDLPSLGMPSSHAAVAFGGAMALATVVPRAWPVAVFAATGCVWTRLASGAHFLTDVYGGMLVAAAVTLVILRPKAMEAAWR